MTKRVESLRAPCLDASSTLATSTLKKSESLFFLFRRLGRSAGGGVAESSASCEIVIVATQLR